MSNEKRIIIRENDPGVPLKSVVDIKNKYIKTGKLKRWVAERNTIPQGGKFFDVVKDVVAPIAVERRARRQIMRAIKTDITAAEWGYPRIAINMNFSMPIVE